MSLRNWLQRLYMHEEIAKLMRSHDRSMSGKIVHSYDGEAWQHFDVEYLDFASDRRNVRLAIATDGRFAIGNGAVRAADIRAAAKEGRKEVPEQALRLLSGAKQLPLDLLMLAQNQQTAASTQMATMAARIRTVQTELQWRPAISTAQTMHLHEDGSKTKWQLVAISFFEVLCLCMHLLSRYKLTRLVGEWQ